MSCLVPGSIVGGKDAQWVDLGPSLQDVHGLVTPLYVVGHAQDK